MDEEDRKIISRWKRLIKQMLPYGPAFGTILRKVLLDEQIYDDVLNLS